MEEIPEESSSGECSVETVCFLNEVAYTGVVSAVKGGPNWDRVEEIAARLDEKGDVNVASLKEVAQDKWKLSALISNVVEEGVYFVEEFGNEAMARAVAAEMEELLESTNATTVISPHIEHDDHEEESRK